MAAPEFYYEIDADNRLRAVSESWRRFAEANEASELARGDSMIGRAVWEFICGEETRHVYGIIFQRVRKEELGVTVPFRCDSPTRRRFMELRIEPLEGGALGMTSRLVKQEERDYMPLMDSRVARSDEYLRVCSWCKLFEVDAEWVEVEEAARRLYLFKDAAMPQLTHAVCDRCALPIGE